MQKLVDLLLSSSHVSHFFTSENLALLPSLFDLILQFLQGRGKLFLIVEKFGDESDVVLHHKRQLFFLFFEGILKFTSQNAL